MVKRVIYKVNAVSATVTRTTTGPVLRIRAAGTVTSPGWKNPSLRKYIYVHQPPDGIQDYAFEAEPPTGIVPMVLRPISVDHKEPYQKWVKGVRIHATTNMMVARVVVPPGDAAKKKPAAKKPAAKKKPPAKKKPAAGK